MSVHQKNFLWNFVEKNPMEDMKENKQKQRERFDGGWKKHRDIYLKVKF